MKWRCLYLKPDNLLLEITKKLHIKILIDSYEGCEDILWIKATFDDYGKVLDRYYEKKGIKMNGRKKIPV